MSCKKWKSNPRVNPTNEQPLSEKEFKAFMKKCKSSSLKKEDCDFFKITSINPLSGRSLSPTGTKHKSLVKKCEVFDSSAICDKWMQDKSKNPRTNRKISPNGKIYKQLEIECKSHKQIKYSKEEEIFLTRFKGIKHEKETMYVIHELYDHLSKSDKGMHDFLKSLIIIETLFEETFVFNVNGIGLDQYMKIIPENDQVQIDIYKYLLTQLIDYFPRMKSQLESVAAKNMANAKQEHEKFYSSLFKKNKVTRNRRLKPITKMKNSIDANQV